MAAKKLGMATLRVVDKKFPTNLATTSISIVEPFRINLEIVDITSIYKGKKSIDDKGVGLNSY